MTAPTKPDVDTLISRLYEAAADADPVQDGVEYGLRGYCKWAADALRAQQEEIARHGRAAELYTEAGSAATLQWEQRAERAEAEVSALQQDADRYWSKKHIDYLKYVRALGRDPDDDEVIAWNMSYDAAIDAARAKEPK